MTDARVLTGLLGGRWHGGYGLAFCPAHENTRTSALSVKDGRLLLHCFAGCPLKDVLAAARAAGLIGTDPGSITSRGASGTWVHARTARSAKDVEQMARNAAYA